MESGDPDYRRLWQSFKDITLMELQRIYGFLEVGFDSYIGEAYFIDHMPKTLELIWRPRGWCKKARAPI